MNCGAHSYKHGPLTHSGESAALYKHNMFDLSALYFLIGCVLNGARPHETLNILSACAKSARTKTKAAMQCAKTDQKLRV